jgi:hypothetical protein
MALSLHPLEPSAIRQNDQSSEGCTVVGSNCRGKICGRPSKPCGWSPPTLKMVARIRAGDTPVNPTGDGQVWSVILYVADGITRTGARVPALVSRKTGRCSLPGSCASGCASRKRAACGSTEG